MKRIVMGVIGIGLTTAVQAEMFKCTDAAGHVTFSQTRCAEDAAPVAVSVHRPKDAEVQAARRTARHKESTL